MLAVVINHFIIFANPLTYLVGAGRLWTGAAEMFFLLSGMTFAIVRGKNIADMRLVIAKTWKRAAKLYVINFLVVLASLAIAFWLTARGVGYNIPASLPSDSFVHILRNILTLQYGFGWASFLMYYCLFLLAAPFALRTLYSRWWPAVPIVSAAAFGLSAWRPVAGNAYFYFLIWQVYFFLGMSIARFRLEILAWYRGLRPAVAKVMTYGIVATAAVTLAVSALLSFKTQQVLAKIKDLGWLNAHSGSINHYLQANRAGLARPLVAILVFTAIYIVYQKNWRFLQARTGNFVNTIGRNSLTVFVAQALTIPLISALPWPHGNILLNTALTLYLLAFMWLVAERSNLFLYIQASVASLLVSLRNLAYLSITNIKHAGQKIITSS